MSGDEVTVLGRDDVGTVAESDGMRYYLTECCGASAKGSANSPTGTCCRACYAEIDPALGDVPDRRLSVVGGKILAEPRPLRLTVVYGDGLPYDAWKERRCHAKPDGGWLCNPAGDLCTHPGGCLLGPDGVRRG